MQFKIFKDSVVNVGQVVFDKFGKPVQVRSPNKTGDILRQLVESYDVMCRDNPEEEFVVSATQGNFDKCVMIYNILKKHIPTLGIPKVEEGSLNEKFDNPPLLMYFTVTRDMQMPLSMDLRRDDRRKESTAK